MTGKADSGQERPVPITVRGVNVTRMQLGVRLRELRHAADLTVAQAADALEFSQAKLSRLENGMRGAVTRDVRDLAQLYGASEAVQAELMEMSRAARSIDRSSNSTIPTTYAQYLMQEATATSVKTFESTMVPGLLQTERYAFHVMTMTADLGAAEIEERIAIRKERQHRLVARIHPLRAHFIIDENVLWRPIGKDPLAVAAREEQLDRLVWASGLDTVTIQVMPYDAGFYPGMEGSTMILVDIGEPGRRPVCYLEGLQAALILRQKQEIEAISQKFDAMQDLALSPERSRALLMRVASGRYRHWSMR